MRFRVRNLLPWIQHWSCLTVLFLSASASTDWPVPKSCFLNLPSFVALFSIILERSLGSRWMVWPPLQNPVRWSTWKEDVRRLTQDFCILHSFIPKSSLLHGHQERCVCVVQHNAFAVTCHWGEFPARQMRSRATVFPLMLLSSEMSRLTLETFTVFPRLACWGKLSHSWSRLIWRILYLETNESKWFSELSLSRNNQPWAVVKLKKDVYLLLSVRPSALDTLFELHGSNRRVFL